MLKRSGAGAAIAALMLTAAAGPAGAQSWGFGVGVGPPIYGPPPVYYDYREPPVYYAPPVVVVPRGSRVGRLAGPGRVMDRLDAAGYRDFGPIERRGDHYSLSAVAPEGDVVALEVSVYTGEIEREFILQPARKKRARSETARKRTRPVAKPVPEPQIAAAPPPAVEAAPPAAPEEPSGVPGSTLRDRLKPLPPASAEPADEGDPDVVY